MNRAQAFEEFVRGADQGSHYKDLETLMIEPVNEVGLFFAKPGKHSFDRLTMGLDIVQKLASQGVLLLKGRVQLFQYLFPRSLYFLGCGLIHTKRVLIRQLYVHPLRRRETGGSFNDLRADLSFRSVSHEAVAI